ncbi:c-type cytochrome domain-containing protein, partial [Singulisphaera rosea]
MRTLRPRILLISLLVGAVSPGAIAESLPQAAQQLVQARCVECHDAGTKKGDLSLEDLPFEPAKPENFARWVKVFDRLESGEMPPKQEP